MLQVGFGHPTDLAAVDTGGTTTAPPKPVAGGAVIGPEQDPSTPAGPASSRAKAIKPTSPLKFQFLPSPAEVKVVLCLRLPAVGVAWLLCVASQ